MTGRSESAPEARPFQATYDIIGSLPVEVLLDIVKYFGPADVFRCQRVCSLDVHCISTNCMVYSNWNYARPRSDGGQFSRPIRSSSSFCAKR